MTKVRSFARVLGVLFMAGACGSDDKHGVASPSGVAGGASENAVSGAKTGSGGSAAANGGKITGTGKEGTECRTDDECSLPLHCVVGDLLQAGETPPLVVKVCARSCHETADCMADEACETLTAAPADALCLSTTTAAFAPCGAADTSVCGGDLKCLRLESETGSFSQGVCIQPCALSGSMEMLAPCPSDLSCSDVLGDPDLGVCAKPSARGETCGIEAGAVCAKEDFCVSDETSSLCYQDCTTTNMCNGERTCTPFRDGDGSFCQ